MKKNTKNKFEINSKSFSLTKVNPYYQNKENYLPYRYNDPSFKIKYNGPLMHKDLYLLNLMNNHFNIPSSKRYDNKPDLPLIKSTHFEISKKKDIIFDSVNYYKNKNSEDKTNYAFSLLKKKFFYFNPVLLKKHLINYRKNRFKGITVYNNTDNNNSGFNSNKFGINFQKQVNENNYLNWIKIKQIHLTKENEGKFDKYHDNDKIYEVLGIENPNIKNKLDSNIRHKSLRFYTRKKSLALQKIDSNVFRPNKRTYSFVKY